LPTILYLLGLPTAEDMTGHVLERAIAPDFLAAHPQARVPSYEGLAGAPGGSARGEEDRAAGAGEASSGAAEDESVAQLGPLGYVGGPADGPATGGRGSGPGPGVAPGAAVPPPGGARGTPGSAGPAGAPGPVGAPGPAGVPTLLYHTNLAAVY